MPNCGRIYRIHFKQENPRPYFLCQRYITRVNGERLAGENRKCITSINNVKVQDDIIGCFWFIWPCNIYCEALHKNNNIYENIYIILHRLPCRLSVIIFCYETLFFFVALDHVR